MSACARCEARLEAWLAGTLDAAERLSVEAHLEACPACRELATLARLADDAPDLTAGILAATTGPACTAAEERLPAYLESALDPTDRRLVALHLETCEPCHDLAAILAAQESLLPALAEMTPPPGFTREVLRALAAAAPARQPALPLDVRLATWLRTAWPRLVARPRFATELAYALTVVGVLAVQATGAFAGAEPRELLTRARTETAERVEALAGAPAVAGTAENARRLGGRLAGFVAGVRETAGTILEEAASSLENEDDAASSTTTEETP
ncbi:MAG: zf-HC2 domain-containing protein [Thermoanaerobaculia bacterium]